jgi:hypothetical protein
MRLTPSLTALTFVLSACSNPLSGAQLPADPIQRSFECVKAAVAVRDGRLAADRVAHWAQDRAYEFQTSVIALEARETPASNPWDAASRIAGEAREFVRAHPLSLTDWTNLQTACQAAYPETSDSAPVTLPANTDSAIVQCTTLAAELAFNGTSGSADIDNAAVQRYAKFVRAHADDVRNTLDRLDVPDYNTESFAGVQAANSVRHGRPDRVFAQCEHSFPASATTTSADTSMMMSTDTGTADMSMAPATSMYDTSTATTTSTYYDYGTTTTTP